MGQQIALLDTSILIEFFRKTEKRNSQFFRLSNTFDDFFISVITEYEIFADATSVTQKAYWKAFLKKVTIIPLDSKIVQTAIILNEYLKKTSNQLNSADLFIVATAILNNVPLATLNNKHFDRIAGLVLV